MATIRTRISKRLSRSEKKQTVSLIAAVGRTNRVIGNGPDIPWHLPADFAYFKRVTAGRPLIMGWKTHQSIGRILPGRKNIVLVADETLPVLDGAEKARSLKRAFASAGGGEIFVIGGGQVYAAAMPLADRLYITFVEGEFAGDVFFPEIDPNVWRELSREYFPANEKNPHATERVIYERSK